MQQTQLMCSLRSNDQNNRIEAVVTSSTSLVLRPLRCIRNVKGIVKFLECLLVLAWVALDGNSALRHTRRSRSLTAIMTIISGLVSNGWAAARSMVVYKRSAGKLAKSKVRRWRLHGT